jgi:hypothetical protein
MKPATPILPTLTTQDLEKVVEVEKEADDQFDANHADAQVIFRTLEEPVLPPQVWEEFIRRARVAGYRVSQGDMEITLTRS